MGSKLFDLDEAHKLVDKGKLLGPINDSYNSVLYQPLNFNS